MEKESVYMVLMGKKGTFYGPQYSLHVMSTMTI